VSLEAGRIASRILTRAKRGCCMNICTQQAISYPIAWGLRSETRCVASHDAPATIRQTSYERSAARPHRGLQLHPPNGRLRGVNATGAIRCRSRLGGLLRGYSREPSAAAA
jgi:hypothetical protein